MTAIQIFLAAIGIALILYCQLRVNSPAAILCLGIGYLLVQMSVVWWQAAALASAASGWPWADAWLLPRWLP